MKQIVLAAAPLALAFTLTGCGGSGGGSSGSGTNPASAKPPAAAATLNVGPCLNQAVIPGRSLAAIAVPDVVTLDPTQASGFPNGRQLQDPVIDLELAALFLDLTKVPVTTLANLPLDPSGNDKPYTGVFPFLAPAWGTPPAAVGGSGFVFRTDAPSAYTRVDRMGEPAISTALIDTADKTAYNDDNPTIDASGKWVPTISADLTALAAELDPQLTALGLPVCAVATTASSGT
jgi:hypothetical protein